MGPFLIGEGRWSHGSGHVGQDQTTSCKVYIDFKLTDLFHPVIILVI